MGILRGTGNVFMGFVLIVTEARRHVGTDCKPASVILLAQYPGANSASDSSPVSGRCVACGLYLTAFFAGVDGASCGTQIVDKDLVGRSIHGFALACAQTVSFDTTLQFAFFVGLKPCAPMTLPPVRTLAPPPDA
jgi:hypothetical protein